MKVVVEEHVYHITSEPEGNIQNVVLTDVNECVIGKLVINDNVEIAYIELADQSIHEVDYFSVEVMSILELARLIVTYDAP